MTKILILMVLVAVFAVSTVIPTVHAELVEPFYGMSYDDRRNTIQFDFWNNSLSGVIMYDGNTIEFEDLPVMIYDNSFKISDKQIRIFGDYPIESQNSIKVIDIESKRIDTFYIKSAGEPFTKKIEPIIIDITQTREYLDLAEKTPMKSVEEYLDAINIKNIPVGNYSNNIIEEEKEALSGDNYYLSVNPPVRFYNDQPNQMQAYVYNKSIQVSGIPVTFDLIKNGIVEATSTVITTENTGARSSWWLNELLTPAGCYEFVVSGTVDGTELYQSDKVKVIRQVGMSYEQIQEITNCKV